MVRFTIMLILVSASLIFIYLVLTGVFRVIIKACFFYKMKEDEIAPFYNALSFRERLFITFVWKRDTSEQLRSGFAIWFLICHYIHTVASILYILWIWIDVFYDLLFNRIIEINFYVAGFHISYQVMESLLTFIMYGALPVSFVLTLPFIFLSRDTRRNFIEGLSAQENKEVSTSMPDED
jgi:hypothetical protein